jgi:hypothetical protein
MPFPLPWRARRNARHCVLAGLAACLLNACAAPWQAVPPGASQSALLAKLGPPKESYALPDGTTRLLWPTRPNGETTTAAVIDPAGRVLSLEQALTAQNFYQARVGVWTRHDVQVRFGLPEQTAYFRMSQRTVWTYRFQDGYWYKLYNFYFDDSGVLRNTQDMPDPLHDPAAFVP